MICSKCNSEISDGARFCTVCGTAFGTVSDVKPIEAPKEPERKYFCTKCGLELQFGAKFCTKCGTPAANVKDITPTVNDGQMFGNGNMAAISLEKQTNANDLVAAMPAPAAAPVPTPVAAAPAPVAEPVPTPVAAAPAPAAEPVPTPVAAAPAPAAEPVPTPVAAAPTPVAEPVPTPVANYNGGVSATAPAAPMPPEFAPPPAADNVSAMGGDVNGLNGVAAASVAVPVKKKGKGGKIALIIGIVLVVLIGAAAVFFFTNKATALSLVMGKPKYAAMVEKESLKKAAKNLDMESLSGQINSVSAIASTYAKNSYRMPMLSMSNTNSEGAQFAKLMNSSMSGYGDFDIDSLLKSYSDIMKSTYGAARISGSVTVNAEFGSEFGDDEYAKYIKDYINGQKLNFDFAATEKTLGFAGGIDFNGKPVDVKMIMEDDGSIYIAFPFASNKAVKVKIPTNSMTRSGAAAGSAGLDIDAKELERIINDLIDIYTDTIKDSTVTMEKGSLIVAGSEITGKKMVVELDGKSAEKLTNAFINYIANDSYLCGQLASYFSGLGLEMTAAELKSELEEAKVAEGTFNTDDKLVITSILTNNGDVLAKSYMFDETELAYAANDKETKFEIRSEEKTVFSLSSVKTSDKDGETEIKIAVKDDQVVSVVMTYTGTEKVKFGNEDVMTGTYSIKVDTSEAPDLNADVKRLNGLTLDYSISVNGSTANIDFGVDVKDTIKLSVKSDITISDDLSTFNTPSDVIDISTLLTSGQLDADTSKELQKYTTDLMKKLKDVFAGTSLEGAFNSALNNIDDIIPGATVDKGKIDELSDDVYTEMMEVYDWFRDNDVYSGDAYKNASEYQKSLRSLNDRISKARNNCTEEQFTEFKNEFSRLLKQKDALKKAIEAEGGNENGGNGGNGGSMGDISFVHGTSEGNTYTSSFLGITATLDSDWNLSPDSDISKLNKINDMSEASIKSAFENIGYIYEMYATTPDNSSINITVEDNTNSGVVSVDEYLAAAKDVVMDSFSSMGFDCTVKEGTVIFCNKNARCLEVTLSSDDVTVYEIQIPIIKDNYTACVTFSSTNKDDLRSFVKMFTAV